jgi:NAD(P)-dependent dehydrogenase (short-subunit alcohol dehydrogenase family)
MEIAPSRAAVVTEGASGLGRAAVKAFREAAFKVAIFDSNEENGNKAALVGMTLTIARGSAREGARVNTIHPGIFETPPLMHASAEMRQALGAMVPFPAHSGDPRECAGLAFEIIRNGYFNGATVHLDGATRMQPR